MQSQEVLAECSVLGMFGTEVRLCGRLRLREHFRVEGRSSVDLESSLHIRHGCSCIAGVSMLMYKAACYHALECVHYLDAPEFGQLSVWVDPLTQSSGSPCLCRQGKLSPVPLLGLIDVLCVLTASDWWSDLHVHFALLVASEGYYQSAQARCSLTTSGDALLLGMEVAVGNLLGGPHSCSKPSSYSSVMLPLSWTCCQHGINIKLEY